MLLNFRIWRKAKELNKLAKTHGLSHKKTLKISKKFDELIRKKSERSGKN